MILDAIKKTFIQLMEKTHQALIFPKNYFGTLMAVFIEQEPVTQTRIEELTTYSKSTVSQMLNLLKIDFSLSILKKQGVHHVITKYTPTHDFRRRMCS